MLHHPKYVFTASPSPGGIGEDRQRRTPDGSSVRAGLEPAMRELSLSGCTEGTAFFTIHAWPGESANAA